MESTNSKIKWGVLGTAGIAKGCTIPGMKQAGNCELYAIAGRNMEKAVSFKDEFGFEKAYGSYEELLADDNVQAVYIPLPNQLHYEWIVKAIKASKHVLCEKPLTPTAAKAKELYALAKENGVLLMEAFAYLHSPYIAALKKEIENNVIGKIKYVETAFITSDYDMSNIRMQKDTYGGSIYDLGCYCTSMIQTILDREPESVKAIAEMTDENIDRFAMAMMSYEGDVKASLNCGMIFENEKGRRFDRLYIHGERGYIKSDVEYNQEGQLSYRVCIDGMETVKTVSAASNYCLEVEQFGRCILEGETPHVSGDFTVKNIRTLERILKEVGY